MQLLILNEHSIVWGVGKSLNWKHMKKNALIFFFNSLEGNGTSGGKNASPKRKVGQMCLLPGTSLDQETEYLRRMLSQQATRGRN